MTGLDWTKEEAVTGLAAPTDKGLQLVDAMTALSAETITYRRHIHIVLINQCPVTQELQERQELILSKKKSTISTYLFELGSSCCCCTCNLYELQEQRKDEHIMKRFQAKE